MVINLTTRKISLSDEQRNTILQRLQFALGRFSPRIQRVWATLRDINGRRGGVDKQFQVRISLRPHREFVVVEDLDASVEVAVANVADRAARAVARALERLREGRFEGTAAGFRDAPAIDVGSPVAPNSPLADA